jgi:hypothetical protein
VAETIISPLAGNHSKLPMPPASCAMRRRSSVAALAALSRSSCRRCWTWAVASLTVHSTPPTSPQLSRTGV